MPGNYFKLTDNAETTLNGNISDVIDSIVVTSVDTLPTTFPYLLTIWDEAIYPDPSDDPSMEIVLVGGATGTTLTSVTRGYGDTSGAAHVSGNRISLLITKEIFTGTTYGIETIIDAHMDADTGEHGVGSDYITKTSKSSQIGEFTATAVIGRSGAVDYLCDGVADDVQIQAAIDALNTADGGTILIREGTYSISSSITLKSNITIKGVGLSTQLNLADGVNASLFNIIGSDITIDSLSIDGNKSNQTVSPCSGIRFLVTTPTKNIILKNLEIANCRDQGIDLIGADVTNYPNHIIIDNVVASNCDRNGIFIGYWAEDWILSNVVSYNHTHVHGEGMGIMIGDSVSYGIVNNAHVYNNELYGLGIGDNINDASISINNLHSYDNDDIGIRIANGKNLYVQGISHGNTGHGLSIYDRRTTDDTPDNIIVDVICHNNGVSGIDVGWTNAVGFTYPKGLKINATCYNNTQHGIQCDAEQFMINAECFNNGRNGFGILSNSQNGQIKGIAVNNDQADFGFNGVDIAGDNIRISGMDLFDDQATKTQTYGLYIRSVAAYTQAYNNNFVTGNQTGNVNIEGGAAGYEIINNMGYNPVGNFTAPSVPATTVNYTNAYGYPCQVLISGGTVTEIDIDDIATGLTAGIFIIPPSGTLNITYSVVPTWIWWGL